MSLGAQSLCWFCPVVAHLCQESACFIKSGVLKCQIIQISLKYFWENDHAEFGGKEENENRTKKVVVKIIGFRFHIKYNLSSLDSRI